MHDTLASIIHSDQFRRDLTRLLVDICRIDTTPNADVGIMRDREQQVFDILEQELAGCSFESLRTERRPIDPAIAAHPAYSQLHFTKTAARPEGLSPEQAYAGRGNLLVFIDGAGAHERGVDVAVNAHIDVVAPFIAPRVEGNVVFGRGACDDKGNVVAMIGALKALSQFLAARQLRLNRGITGMIVVEEETGGNGSLALALDRDLRARYDAMLVLECCENRIYPANRGAVWYRFDISVPEGSDFEMAGFVIEQLEKEGRAIRAESRHRLFPQRPVQTCHGMIDHFGEHPSRICGHVAFRIDLPIPPTDRVEELVRDCLDAAVAEYCGLYGDKTREVDPATGRAKVARHYELHRDANGFAIDVFGSSGHMGSILEHDGAITKMATMVRALVLSRGKLRQLAGAAPVMELVDRQNRDFLKLEGGQGFVPTHTIDEIMERMTAAARRGAAVYHATVGENSNVEQAVRSSYEKLHNAAYDGDPDSAPMQLARDVARRLGMWPADRPVVGWTVSCDARLFANEHPKLPVLTCGTGCLADAHSDHEQLDIDALLQFVEFLATYLLEVTGSGAGSQ